MANFHDKVKTFDGTCSTCGSNELKVRGEPVERKDLYPHPSHGHLWEQSYECDNGHTTKVLGYKDHM
jgi:hypothetical protein